MRFVVFLTCLTQILNAENWPAWRGPRGDGSSLESSAPLHWSTTQNIAWRTIIPGDGHSSPVVWDDKVFLTTAITNLNQRQLLCLNRQTGVQEWARTVLKTEAESIHRLNSRASGTPATDGNLIFVAFMRVQGEKVVAPNVGSERLITPGRVILAAYNLAGEEQWTKDVGPFLSAHGFNSSPVLFQNLVILNGDHDGQGYIVALDQATGTERWRIERPYNTRSYVTPIIRVANDRTQMVLSGSHTVMSYDPTNGNEIWRIDGPTEQFVATMVYNGDYFFITGGYPQKHILALRSDGRGNVSDKAIAWRTNRGASYVPSPIVIGPNLYVVTDSGILSCFDAKTGDRHWMERLPGGHSASPIAVGNHIYFTSDQGKTTIIDAGSAFKVRATNDLEEATSASPAISHGQLFIRTHTSLYCIGKPTVQEIAP